MKKIYSIILIFLLLNLQWGNAYALAVTNNESDFIIKSHGLEVEIIDYIGIAKDVIIPEKINGKVVTKIGYKAFESKGLTSVIIPSSVMNIDGYAFQNNELTSVIIPENVRNIGNYAFENNQLTSVLIPKGLTEIRNGVFARNKLVSIEIPSNVKTIGDYAFTENQLTNVFFQEGIRSIGSGAFSKNYLMNIDFPSSLEEIGNYAFAWNNLFDLVLHDGLTRIGRAAFFNNQLMNITLPKSITSIEESTFGLNQLGSVQIPENVKNIGSSSFSGNQLTDVKIPESVTNIGNGAFFGNNLKRVEIPPSITRIEENVFAYNELTSVDIPESVTWVGKNAFRSNNLTSIQIPPNVTYLGESVFANNKLTSVEIPSKVHYIGNSSFAHNQLNNVMIADGVKIIGAEAFKWNELTDVIIPMSVESIGYQAFAENKLKSVKFNGTFPNILDTYPFDSQRYSFYGWYTDKTFKTPWDNWVKSPMTIYSQWDVYIYYNLNGDRDTYGPLPRDDNKYKSGDPIIVKGDESFWRPGYNFVGWNTKKDGSGDWYQEGDILIAGQESITLYAQWKEKTTSPPISASNVTVTNNYNKEDVISFKNLEIGSIYTIYKDITKYTILDSFEATSSNMTRTINQLGKTAGYIYISVTHPKQYESALTEIKYAAEPSPPIAASNVTVTNNYNKDDVITFKNLKKGSTYTIYKDNQKKTKLDSFKATGTTATRKIRQLGGTAGSIFISIMHPDQLESSLTEVKYSAEPSSPIKASNVTVKNNYKKDDVITFKNLQKSSTYTIYQDKSKKKKLDSFKATGSSATRKIKQLGTSSGSIYITVKKPNYKESAVTKVSYKAEKLPALSAKNVTVKNNIGNDKITLKGLTKGFKYTIYKDKVLKKKLTSFTATGKTKTLTVKQVGANGGTLYIVASKKGYLSSSATKVKFKAEPTPALSSKNVKVINTKKGDTIKLLDLKKGTTYVIYKDKKLTTKLASFNATGSKKTIKVKQLGKKAGKIYITAKKSGYLVSKVTTVSFPKEK